MLGRVERIIAEKNAHLQSYARIKRFAVLPGRAHRGGGEVTPTQKLKRKQVAEKYADLLESLYDGERAPDRASRARGPFYRGMGVGLGSSASTV